MQLGVLALNGWPIAQQAKCTKLKPPARSRKTDNLKLFASSAVCLCITSIIIFKQLSHYSPPNPLFSLKDMI